MSSRRSFLSTAAVAAAAAGFSGIDITPASAAKPKGPSALSVAIAKSLQKTMPDAHLSDARVEKIAGDIDGYAPTAADFRKTRLNNWDEPDFVFAAGPMESK